MTARILPFAPIRTTTLVMLCPDHYGCYTRDPLTITIETATTVIKQWKCEHCGTFHTLKTVKR